VRVLYFHQHFTTLAGAGGIRSYEMARTLVSRGHEVLMVCGDNDRDPLELPPAPDGRGKRGVVDGIEVIALPVNYSNRQSIARRAAMFLRFALHSIRIAGREPHDVLFATSTPLTAALPGIMRKLLGAKQPFLFEVRDLWPELPRALGMKNPLLLAGMSALEWLAYRCADTCVGLAPGIVNGIRKRAPRNRRVELVPNGCDLTLFAPGKRAPLSLPGIGEDDFVAGFIGAHGNANGLDALLDVAVELKRLGRSKIKLLLVGDGKCKDDLVARAQREELDNCVFRPLMKKMEVATVTASLGCGLQVLANVPAFYYGTSPNKFFDYLSAGLPVINNYPGWLAELIVEHRCGLTVSPANPVAFAEALCWLADQPRLREEMGANARRLAEARFAREELTRRLAEIIEETVRSE